MKFAKLRMELGKSAYGTAAIGQNLGDEMMILALEHIYRAMGVPESEIVSVDFCDLSHYSGEYVLLPILGLPPITTALGLHSLSPKIIPVFISTQINCYIQDVSKNMLMTLRSYAPIGCRDENTLQKLRQACIPAYLAGCVTMVFPKRERAPKPGKVFLVDIPDSLRLFLPKEIAETGVELSHLQPITSPEEYEETTRRFLTRYRDEASLVISSRLHALAPCIAMGIPVIAAVENCSHRFSFIDKYIPIYTPSRFGEIDWDPKPVEFETEKRQILELFCSQIRKAYETYHLPYTVSEFYENRTRSVYGSRYMELVQALKSSPHPLREDFSYLIWGCGLIGESTLEAVGQVFPKARLHAAVDTFVTGTWHGREIIKPERIAEYPEDFVFLAGYSLREAGYKKMRELGREEGKDFLYLGTCNG